MVKESFYKLSKSCGFLSWFLDPDFELLEGEPGVF